METVDHDIKEFKELVSGLQEVMGFSLFTLKNSNICDDLINV